MKNLQPIYLFIIIMMSACSTSEKETREINIEKEKITIDVPVEEELEKPIEKEELKKLTRPYGKLLYSMNELFIYENKAALKGNALYDADAELAQLIKEEESEECKVDYNYAYHPLSLVGAYYSYESTEWGMTACGPLGSSRSVGTINIETLESVKLTDVFKEASIIAALKKDTWVKRKAEEQSINLDEINTFDDFLNKKSNSEFSNFNVNSFAVLDFNKETNLVAIRLITTSYMGFNHSEYLQIGMWIEPENVKIFREKSYFYMDRFKNGLYK